MRIAIRQIGNSKGVIIPATMLLQAGLEAEAELSIEEGALVLRQPAKALRSGWAEASQALAQAEDDGLLLPEFANEMDKELEW